MSSADSGKCIAKIQENSKMCKCNECSGHRRDWKSNIYQVTINQQETLIEYYIFLICSTLSMKLLFWCLLLCRFIKEHWSRINIAFLTPRGIWKASSVIQEMVSLSTRAIANEDFSNDRPGDCILNNGNPVFFYIWKWTQEHTAQGH